ncbi:MAG: hypothetical protein ACRD8O_20955 [Bryobacteraceae bacterium]
MEISVLRYIDVLIGFSIVMLIASSAVTFLTQAVFGASSWRGRKLRDGLETLISQIDASLARHAHAIAEAVLRHPIVASPTGGLGAVIEREGLIRVLLELAAGRGTLDPGARAALAGVIERDLPASSAEVLQRIENRYVEIQKEHPGLAVHVSRAQAIWDSAKGSFVARVYAWFDEMSESVSTRFRFHARAVTFASALIVAFSLQLDSLNLLNRLSVDPELRKTLVAEAGKDNVEAKESLKQLMSPSLAILPAVRSPLGDALLSPGIWLTCVLLTLGAPFWYDRLKDLLKLRPALAKHEESQRGLRRAEPAAQQAAANAQAATSQPAVASAQPAVPVPATGHTSDEEGDPLAVGAVG